MGYNYVLELPRYYVPLDHPFFSLQISIFFCPVRMTLSEATVSAISRKFAFLPVVQLRVQCFEGPVWV